MNKMMKLAIKIAVCFFALVHVYEPEPKEVIIPITEENAVAIIETIEAPTEAVETTTEIVERPTETPKAPTANGFVAYSAYGITPPIEWQKALYNELSNRGIAWYWKYAFCQVFQESRWNQYADNGRDKGITQQKAVYWYGRAARYGAAGADIWDVYAQFKVYAGMMAEYLRVAKGDVGWSLSYYFYGNGQRADKYVADVMSHLSTLKEVK